jgi:uncharacterized membrane protein YgcG
MIKKVSFVLFLSAFSFFVLNSSVFAQTDFTERIVNFSSDIKVNQDASILVNENITVYANGQTIKHGIYRDFPTTYKDKFGNKYIVEFNVKDVKVNDISEIYKISSLSNGVRIQIGKADVLLNPGIYKYSITYQVSRELGFFPDHDELYWNVTGNGWNYNIENVNATVTLPASINYEDVKTDAYTGPFGSKEGAYSSSVSPGVVSFSSTRTLNPYDGMTIVVSWPKGFVVEPTKKQLIDYWFSDNLSSVFSILGLLIVLLYYLFVWNKYGRDPLNKTIVAIYEPPKDISPAVARYLMNKYFDDKCLVADIIDLAVKGYIKIQKKITRYNLILTDKKYDSSVVLDSQKILLETLFVDGNILDMGKYDADIRDAESNFLLWITDNYKKNYFTHNIKYFVMGILLSAISIIFSILVLDEMTAVTVIFMSIWLSVWSFGVVFLIKSTITLWGKKNKFQAIFSSLFSIPFIAAEIFAIIVLYRYVSSNFIFSLILILLIIVNIIFYFLLKQYTEKGLRLVEELLGFKLFLSVTEQERMNFHNPPEKTPELFEKYLPYALALGVENKWAEQFAEVFIDKDMMDHHPLWYSDSIYNSSFVSSFSNSFSNSISSSVTSPGSSSGLSGGGGGGSGGGGGGGGGGGW